MHAACSSSISVLSSHFRPFILERNIPFLIPLFQGTPEANTGTNHLPYKFRGTKGQSERLVSDMNLFFFFFLAKSYMSCRFQALSRNKTHISKWSLEKTDKGNVSAHANPQIVLDWCLNIRHKMSLLFLRLFFCKHNIIVKAKLPSLHHCKPTDLNSLQLMNKATDDAWNNGNNSLLAHETSFSICDSDQMISYNHKHDNCNLSKYENKGFHKIATITLHSRVWLEIT